MQHSIGKTIKELRKSRGLTQEELAEKIGVTAQAISKWENESGMPDLSQIVPLAHVFGVSADTILGTGDIKKNEDVSEIMRRAQSKLTFPLTTECLTDKYNVLLEGLKIYPNNFTLILQCMELEISLAYPANPIYDEKNAKALYESCERHANTIFSYDDNVNRILRARMIMLMLHSANGKFEEARRQAEKFPSRADFNIHKMYSIHAHWQKDYKTEITSWQFYIMNLLHALLYGAVSLGKAYDLTEEPDKAMDIYQRLIKMLDVIFEGETKMPFHHVEGGDIYVLLAEKAMEFGNSELALDSLEKAINYDIKDKEELITSGFKIESPFLSNVGSRLGDRFQNLEEIMTNECFAPLRDNERYKKMLSEIEEFNKRSK
ncbi:MAG: helix-turn-helix transcriptional regulator [Clostridia bacterium]|nr:helix-turn-helix transcriptional regulator [Clostridia bacterium]